MDISDFRGSLPCAINPGDCSPNDPAYAYRQLQRATDGRSFEDLVKPNAANRRAKAHKLFMEGEVTSALLISKLRTVTPSKVISELRSHYRELGVRMQCETRKSADGKRYNAYWLIAEDKRKLMKAI